MRRWVHRARVAHKLESRERSATRAALALVIGEELEVGAGGGGGVLVRRATHTEWRRRARAALRRCGARCGAHLSQDGAATLDRAVMRISRLRNHANQNMRANHRPALDETTCEPKKRAERGPLSADGRARGGRTMAGRPKRPRASGADGDDDATLRGGRCSAVAKFVKRHCAGRVMRRDCPALVDKIARAMVEGVVERAARTARARGPDAAITEADVADAMRRLGDGSDEEDAATSATAASSAGASAKYAEVTWRRLGGGSDGEHGATAANTDSGASASATTPLVAGSSVMPW